MFRYPPPYRHNNVSPYYCSCVPLARGTWHSCVCGHGDIFMRQARVHRTQYMQAQCVCSICYSILYGECTTEEPSACDVWQVPIWHHFVLQVDTTYTFISDLRIIVPVGAAQAPYSIVQVHIGELYTNHMFTRMVIGTISAHTYIQLYIDIMQLLFTIIHTSGTRLRWIKIAKVDWLQLHKRLVHSNTSWLCIYISEHISRYTVLSFRLWCVIGGVW